MVDTRYGPVNKNCFTEKRLQEGRVYNHSEYDYPIHQLQEDYEIYWIILDKKVVSDAFGDIGGSLPYIRQSTSRKGCMEMEVVDVWPNFTNGGDLIQ